MAVNSQSHRPKHIPIKVPVDVEERIVVLRLSLTEQYNRKVGPRTIAAYLKREKDAWPGLVPTSSATIWRILRRRQYILPPLHEQKTPFDRPDPGLPAQRVSFGPTDLRGLSLRLSFNEAHVQAIRWYRREHRIDGPHVARIGGSA